ncbi:MAG: hypothetical protein GWO24_12060, partial [Akkermansiaceae bacterium]|nr:hypothetical protein [Akkermansiaceae bacterium]
SDRDGYPDVYSLSVDESSPPEVIYGESGVNLPEDVDPTGEWLLVNERPLQDDEGRGNDIWIVPLKPPGEARSFKGGDGNETHGRFSPDGNWIAYVSD